MTTTEKGPRFARGPIVLLIVAIFIVTMSSVASAHAERTSSQPEEGARLDQVPTTLAIDFSEPPTGDAVLEVLDGCGNDVVETLNVQNQEISAELLEGQPGRWSVTSTVVSGIDGHQTKDSWKFAVAGKADCSEAAAGSGERGPQEEEDSDFPIIPVVAGAIGVLVVAVLLRVMTGRSED